MGNLTASLLALVSFAFVGSSESATFMPKEFGELVAEADQIFIGTASQANARYTLQGAIVTDYLFDDVEFIKGGIPPKPIVVTMLGGTVGSESVRVSGAPTFHLGTRYLLFVSGNGSDMFPLVGGPQGIFRMRADPSDGVLKVHDYGGRPVTQFPSRKTTASKEVARGAVSPTQISTEAFVRAIRSKISP